MNSEEADFTDTAVHLKSPEGGANRREGQGEGRQWALPHEAGMLMCTVGRLQRRRT